MSTSEQFKNPSTRYRGISLWMLNDKLTEAEIHAQLEAFHAGGWGGVIARTFPGLLTPYLSDEWTALMQSLVKKAGELGMRAWLQAAYMPSAVPDLPEEIQYRGLKAVRKDIPDHEAKLTGISAGAYGGKGEGFETLAEDDAYTYQCGRITEVLDLLNGPAVTEYLENAYKKPWYDHIGDQFGRTVEAVWVDEPHFRPHLLPFNKKLPALIRDRFGYDVLQTIGSVFHRQGDWQKVRHHYWRTITDMFMNAYFRHVGQWCGDHGIKFAGHLMGEDSLQSQIAWTGAAMQAYEHMQLPGIDHLTMDLTWPMNKKFILTPKQATSVANQLGKKEVLAEIYAVSSHRITFAKRKRIFNWMAVQGISYRCNHAAFYSMRGARKRMYVPHLGKQQPWWEHNRMLADYCARLSFFLQQGTRTAEVLVLHPVESGYCVYDPVRNRDRDKQDNTLAAMSTRLIDLCDTLLSMQRDFEFGDEALMAKYATVTGERLDIGEAAYRLVVLPDLITLRESTVDLLNTFITNGGTVLAAGTLPERVDGVHRDDLDRETGAALDMLLAGVTHTDADKDSLTAAVDTALPRRFTLEGSAACTDVWVQTRTFDGRTGYLLVNTSPDTPVHATLRITAPGALETWNLETGDSVPAPGTVSGSGITTPVILPPDGALLLVQNPADATVTKRPPVLLETDLVRLHDTPAVQRLAPNALPLDMARFRKGDGAWSDLMATTMIQKTLQDGQYHGPVGVEYAFNVTDAPSVCALVVETPELYRITVNGTTVDPAAVQEGSYIDPAFKALDIAAAVRSGANTVLLECDYHAIEKANGLQSQHEVHDGTEIEAVYVTGAFAVTGTRADTPPAGCVQYADRTIVTEPATAGWNLSAAGYPYFAGSIVLTNTVTLRAAEQRERVFLKLAGLAAPTCLVRVNGKDAGQLAWRPLELDITALVTAGDNTVEIEFASSLRNVMGPFHRKAGEPDSCWRNAWDDLTGITEFEHPDEAAEWTDDYLVIDFGTGAPPEIIFRKAR